MTAVFKNKLPRFIKYWFLHTAAAILNLFYIKFEQKDYLVTIYRFYLYWFPLEPLKSATQLGSPMG